jgi:uncharacterized protein YjbJ (UPF0337 family)
VGIIDRISGRAKKAAGAIAGDRALRREGRSEGRKGEAKDELACSDDQADRKAEDVSDLERRT